MQRASLMTGRRIDRTLSAHDMRYECTVITHSQRILYAVNTTGAFLTLSRTH